jgi:cytochrome d oxidase subunit CydB
MANVDLARWQFAFVTINHFFFVPITIGLAFLTALLQTAWYRGKRDEYLRLTRFFGTLLVINIAIGVVTGLVHVTSSSTFFLNPVELLAVLAVLAAIAAIWLVHSRSDGFAFAATTVTMAACVVSIFTGLYPNVMVSSTNTAYNLTVHNTASGAYSLKVMTVVVVIFLPFVLAYQTWTYYVFRRRISKQEFRPSPQRNTLLGAPHPPLATPVGGPPVGQGN